MGNVIQWADYVKALNEITKEQQLVSGMSVEEAATALNYTKSASGMYLKTVMTTSAESVAGTTATEVAGAAATEASTTAVNLTLVEGAGGVAEVAGVGAVALPIAATMAASVGGYLIGKELNKNQAYSTFFGNLVFAVGNFVTGKHLKYDFNEENAPTVPVLYDNTGKVFLPTGAVSAVKTYLDSVSSTLLAGASAKVRSFGTAHAVILGPYGSPAIVYYLLISDMPFTASMDGSMYVISSAVQYRSGKWVAYDGATWSAGSNNDVAMNSSTPYTGKIPYSTDTIIFNGSTLISSNWNPSSNPGTLPTPITKYTPALPINTPITDPNGNTWSQVYLPSTSPTEMPDGEPVPTTAPDPARITPYITPVQPQPAQVPIVIPSTPSNPIILPNPEPDTSTAPYPASEPAVDPSQISTPLTPSGTESIPDPVNSGAPVLPVLPSVPAPSSAKGLLHVYNPTSIQVDQFGEWLWTTFSGDLIDTISKLFNNPMDAVIGLHELYCTPNTSGTMNIRAGYLDSGVASRLVSNRYVEIHCGALSVPEFWHNYLDYSPYTKSYCYLPFIGIVELNADDIVGSGVEITYRVDSYNGSCIALITTAKPNSAESVTYQFEGNCAVSVPITSGMMTALQNGLMGIATTALTAGATAAVTAATGGAALPAAVMIGTVGAGAAKQGLTSKNQVQYSGSFGSSYGAMGIKKPFLIIKRPRQKVVYGYNENYGYPAHKMVAISDCSGYLRAIEVDVISPTATEAEKKMIEELLKTGIFVN